MDRVARTPHRRLPGLHSCARATLRKKMNKRSHFPVRDPGPRAPRLSQKRQTKANFSALAKSASPRPKRRRFRATRTHFSPHGRFARPRYNGKLFAI